MKRTLASAVLALVLLGACGDDDDSGGAGTTTVPATTTTAAATTTTAPGLEQPAIWPAADVVFATPEEAAEDFVTEVLEVPPAIGEFQQGDARSGEIEVYSPGEGGAATQVVRSVLLLRQLGPDDGWFVIGAVNDNASITTPESLAEVEAGVIEVSGVARGFEANVVVTAYLAGEPEPLDQEVTMGGSMETPEPFSVELDLSDTAPGDVVMLLVRGGVGLETDPGDFGAIPVVITG
jgi:hypothetical protein